MKTTSAKYKEGVTVKLANELPHVQLIRTVALATAPDTADGICWTTEAWRPPRHTDDAHNWCNAFDLRVWNIEGNHREEKILKGWDWIKRMRLVLNDQRYQFDQHGKGNGIHIHAEFDPR